jgi:SAM-dependent methyltransferase
LVEALRLAISSRVSDRDDFKRLVLRSNEGTQTLESSRTRGLDVGADTPAAEISFRRDADGRMVCERDGTETYVQEDEIFDSIEDFARRGFTSLTCECWSGDVHIEVPADGRGRARITYSQPSVPGLEKSPQPPFPKGENLRSDEAKHLIDHLNAGELLKAIDIAAADGSIRADMRRKYVQIDNFVKLIQPLLNKSTQRGKVFILDCGCGKSYLSFVMNYFLREKLRRNCHFFCIDTNSALINKCLRIREELGYGNMEFRVSEIRDFEPREKIDIVCSLHACDTASDEAIARGIQLQAPFLLVVPCCQHEVINQLKDHPLKAVTRHGLYKARLADLLTDALRTLILEAAGYKVSVTEYVSPIYTPKNIMIQAEKIQSGNKMAMEQYLELKATFGNVSLELERMLPELFL